MLVLELIPASGEAGVEEEGQSQCCWYQKRRAVEKASGRYFVITTDCIRGALSDDEALMNVIQAVGGQFWVVGVESKREGGSEVEALIIPRQLDESEGDDEFVNINITVERRDRGSQPAGSLL